MNPTVSNVYKATYSSSQVQDYRQKTKMTEISDELFEELKPQLKQILEEAHIDSSDENLNQCRWLIDEDIAVTPDNVLLANQVDCINAAEVLCKGSDRSTGNGKKGYRCHYVTRWSDI